MESVLRRFGLKKGEPRDSEARQKLQRDLFAFSKVCLPFPNTLTAFDILFQVVQFAVASDELSSGYIL